MSAKTATLRPQAFELEQALDTLALQRLGLAYCHAIDRRDFALLRTLYHDDAIDDHSPMFYGNADEFAAWIPEILGMWEATAHIIHNTLFLIDGDQAEGELVMTAYHRSIDGAREVIAHGRYIDQYRKRDDIWRFFRRSLCLDWLEERPAPVRDGSGIEAGVTMGSPSADDPCYQRLALFASQRASRQSS